MIFKVKSYFLEDCLTMTSAGCTMTHKLGHEDEKKVEDMARQTEEEIVSQSN